MSNVLGTTLIETDRVRHEHPCKSEICTSDKSQTDLDMLQLICTYVYKLITMT